MIKYNLICECGKTFESWFSSSDEHDVQREKNLLIVFIVILPRLENQLWLRIYLAKQIKLLKILI